VIILMATLHGVLGNTDSFRVPSKATLAGLSRRQRILALAKSQVGYSTDPSNSYCNKYGAYWKARNPHCPAGNNQEKWCADFAAWTWQKAGVHFTYGYHPGEINGAAASFYELGAANDEWHPAASGYVAAPGDVAVYGLSFRADPSAVHVAIVTDDPPGQRGPDVVNGDGDRTGFSVVEAGTHQVGRRRSRRLHARWLRQPALASRQAAVTARSARAPRRGFRRLRNAGRAAHRRVVTGSGGTWRRMRH
jgi:hypothetical protein